MGLLPGVEIHAFFHFFVHFTNCLLCVQLPSGCLGISWAFLVPQMVRNPPAMRETWVRSLGWEDLLEKGMATHSSILAWRIPWTEEPGRLQSMGSQKSQTRLSDFHFHFRHIMHVRCALSLSYLIQELGLIIFAFPPSLGVRIKWNNDSDMWNSKKQHNIGQWREGEVPLPFKCTILYYLSCPSQARAHFCGKYFLFGLCHCLKYSRMVLTMVVILGT